MTEPILIASAILALGRFLSRGQGGVAVREASPDLSTALPPMPPPVAPPMTAPPVGPLVMPPEVAQPPPPAPPPAPPRSSPPSKRGTGSGGSKPKTPRSSGPSSTTPSRGTTAPPAQGTPPEAGAPPAAPGAVIKDRARLDRAAQLARQVADDVKARKKAYDRQLCAEFQRTAGLVADGIYGPKTAGAVKWFTGEVVPPQSGRGFAPYAPNF